MRLSVVVPALDEADRIAATLAPLQALRAAGDEIIVVDGGSRDGTLARAAPLADRAFIAPRGRAAQMNAGAAVARGDVLLFLHADSHLGPDAVDALRAQLRRSRRHWGRFDVTIAGRFATLRPVAALMNLRSRLTGIATGDQGIFVERALFDRVGGYPRLPLMEDVELSRRLKRAGGAPLCLRTRIVVSGRRWEQYGLGRTIVTMWWLRFAHWCGVDASRLARWYGSARTAEQRDAAPGTDRVRATPEQECRRAAPVPDCRRAPPVLQVFAKAPVPGAVKTRLAGAIGALEAATVYRQLVERTLATAAAARDAGIVRDIELWCAPDSKHPAFAAWRDRYGVKLATQLGGDLGKRMRHALDVGLARGAPALLVGTDCPQLDVDYVERAARALIDHDAVFGPAEDGGYVLVGLARSLDVFDAIPWGGPAVMGATRTRLVAQRASWQELPSLWDVDEAADLARWRALAPGRALDPQAAG